MKKQQESLKNMVYQAILNGILPMNINPIKLSTSRSWYRNSAAARHRSVKPL